MQRHIWTLPEGNGHPPPNHTGAVFAACPHGHLLAYVQQAASGQQQVQVVSRESLQPASTIKVFACVYLCVYVCVREGGCMPEPNEGGPNS